MGNEVNTSYRQQAVDWLNSKDRNLDKGLEILKKSGYKPYVIDYLQKHRNRRDVPQKIVHNMRLFIRYTVNPDNPVHEDNPPANQDPDPQTTFLSNLEKELQIEYPPIVKKVVYELAGLYNTQDIYRKKQGAYGDKDDAQTRSERKELYLIIDATGRRIDVLYKALNEYKKSGTLPDESLFAEIFDPEKVVPKDPDKTDTKTSGQKTDKQNNPHPETPEDLQKQKKNIRSKISKAENRLKYQSESRQEKENPMPEGPKRVELEERISKLKEELAATEEKIAKLK